MKYKNVKFNRETKFTLHYIKEIVEQFMTDGHSLTVRQLYYQLVSRGLIDNSADEYKRVSRIVNSARLAGEIPWEAIQDRTRSLCADATYNSADEFVNELANLYKIDVWERQRNYIEIWSEKDSIIPILDALKEIYRVPYLITRGFPSQTEIYLAAQRIRYYDNLNVKTHIIYCGDHDPSGLEIRNDIVKRISVFCSDFIWEFDPILLTMEQAKEFNIPASPATRTDTRGRKYVEQFGDEQFELEALHPETIRQILESAVSSRVDHASLSETLAVESAQVKKLIQSIDKTRAKR